MSDPESQNAETAEEEWRSLQDQEAARKRIRSRPAKDVKGGTIWLAALLTKESLEALHKAINGYGRHQSLSKGDLLPMRMAVDGLGRNGLALGPRHGRQPELRVLLRHEGQDLKLTTQDNTKPLKVTDTPGGPELKPLKGMRPVGALGLTVLGLLVDRIRYRQENGWNELSLEWKRRQAPKREPSPSRPRGTATSRDGQQGPPPRG